ncbi:aminoglycoside phosphotransferase family protein [Actinomadura sp. ATCC 31491]|uniref:Aminoglycoside phosphotransferase family protein n=1 Tax=Actinomadura luzonensis TaxID=2805427 RepID=A0ABT0G520_9ACTN|nr:aminoglycoside phosphotransferase family protein [Actinomadura luzonensis]MCK2219599.1 aminoglycoside phosphotransferase family protein [Actinomadura luzonensis]
MTGDIRALLARHLPGYQVRTIVPLGQGLDHTVSEVNGELLIRLPKAADPEAVRQEAARLAAVAELSPLPVPEVVFADAEAGVLACRKLPGRPLNEHPPPDPARLAGPLGRFLGALHAADPGRMRDLAPLDLYPAPALLQDAELDYRDVEAHVPVDQRALVERFLAEPPPGEPRSLRFCHNDLGAEHILVDAATGTVTGVIDWSDAAVTDPAHDFARLYRDLGPGFFELTAAHYPFPLTGDDRARIRFHARCALIEDLAYGLSTGPRHYADAALAHLARTFS